VTPVGPGLAYYEPAPAESADAVMVHAAFPVAVGSAADHDFTVVDLPGIRSAATIIHRGPMDEADDSMQILARWVDDNGYRPDGYAREVYLDYCADAPETGVTELQLTVSRD
jgi:effector-binding domain-containing protein